MQFDLTVMCVYIYFLRVFDFKSLLFLSDMSV